MRILFEEHQYPADKVSKSTLKEICDLQNVEKKISVSYVGYFYSPELKDCVFILPKVLLTDIDEIDQDGKGHKVEELANVVDEKGTLVHIKPEDIITPEGQKKLPPEYSRFIYEFAVWIYRSLSVYRMQNPTSKAIYYKQLPQEGRGQKHKPNTFLDVILSLIRFNIENQDFFLFTIKNIHSGHNKINWARTISHTSAIVHNDEVIYLNPVNKKSQINFDEELFIIFFSILQYLNDQYGFRATINCQYELIKGKQFKTLLNGMGKIKLRNIKYKYFSDRALQLWNLCYAFFDSAHKLVVNTSQKEYLLAKSYEHVFEAMIDELIGDDDIPKGLKEQNDGKRVDHMYTYRSLTNSDDDSDDIFYIGDSKYYKSGHKLEYKSIYKQYTYARNVIQWNIDLLFKGTGSVGRSIEEVLELEEDKTNYGKIRLRDDEDDPLTEGYNVIPNFFISAFVSKDRKYVDEKNIRIHEEKGVHSTYVSYQYKDRLFDRDTLILSHYDVNFLYVLYLYGRNKQHEKAAWKKLVRELFRKEIRSVLEKKYDFYALKSIGNPLAGEQFITEHFKELQGKLIRPYGDRNLYALALEHDGTDTKESDTFKLLSEFFVIDKINKLGENPKDGLEQKAEQYSKDHPYVPVCYLPEYHVEGNLDKYFVVGLYHDQEHWDWITGKNDKGSLIYNVRLYKDGEGRIGSLTESHIRKMKPKFVILYEEGHASENKYHVFRVHDYAVMTEERMKRAKYPTNHGSPYGDYFIFRLDEEISIGQFDISKIIADQANYKGEPVFLKGDALMSYKLK